MSPRKKIRASCNDIASMREPKARLGTISRTCTAYRCRGSYIEAISVHEIGKSLHGAPISRLCASCGSVFFRGGIGVERHTGKRSRSGEAFQVAGWGGGGIRDLNRRISLYLAILLPFSRWTRDAPCVPEIDFRKEKPRCRAWVKASVRTGSA